MDIEQFYAGDHRRQQGEDNAFGLDWTDASRPHNTFDLYYNDGSHELYLMAKPVLSPWLGFAREALTTDIRAVAWAEHRIVGVAEDLIHPRHIHAKTGAEHPDPPEHWKDALTEELGVEILATIPSLGEADVLLKGWQDAMPQPDSVAWLRSRVSVGESAH